MNEILKEAKKHYENGSTKVAHRLIEEILEKEPENSETLALLGVIYAYENKFIESKKILEEVLRLNEKDFESMCNMGYVLDKLGEQEDAVVVNEKAVKLRPTDYWANLNYAVSLLKTNQFDLSIEYLNNCKTIDQNNYIAWMNEAKAYQAQKKHKQAINIFNIALKRCDGSIEKKEILKNKFNSMLELNMFNQIINEFKKIATIEANNYELLIQAGVAYAKLKSHTESLIQFNAANEILPDNYLAIFNLGKANYELGNYLEALNYYEKCINIYDCFDSKVNKIAILIELNINKEAIEFANKVLKECPKEFKVEIYINIAKAYINIGEYKESLFWIEAALTIEKRYEALFNKAVALQSQKKYIDANEIYLRNISNNNNDYESRYNLATSYLSTLNFKEGWAHYESRWNIKKNDAKKLQTKLPYLKKESYKARAFIWREQGLGDEILFSTMYEDIKKISSNYTVQADSRLIEIFKRTYPKIEFVASDEKIKQNLYDQHIPAGGLGAYLRTSREDFKGNQNKLKANAKLVEKYKLILNKYRDRKLCGITWRSNNKNIGEIKSLNLEEYLPILKNSNYFFVNLQYDSNVEEIVEFNRKYGVNLININEVDHYNDIESHLAIIEICDLIISVSNSTAHLSGALGKRTYLLAPHGSSLMWYWLNNDINGNNLWYPTINVNEQEKQNMWSNTIQKIYKKLENP